jgi:CRISPR-associated protein Cas2
MDVLVTYDIDTTTREGAKRLGRVARICEGYGVRAQKSVFECRLSETRLQQLLSELMEEIVPSIDSVHLYRFNGSLSDSRTSIGRNVSHDLGEPWII